MRRRGGTIGVCVMAGGVPRVPPGTWTTQAPHIGASWGEANE